MMEGTDFGSMHYERTTLWVALRYTLVLIGAVLIACFGASVLYDNEDLAWCSWETGGGLLFEFASYAKLIGAPLLILSALLRRGARRLVRLTRETEEGIELTDEAGRRVAIPKSAVASSFLHTRSENADAATATLTLTLNEGRATFGMKGDQIVLTLPTKNALAIHAAFAQETTEADLSTRGYEIGGTVLGVSLALGIGLGVTAFRAMIEVVAKLPTPSHYLPVVENADRGWLWGLCLTGIGLVHAAISMLVAAPRVEVSSTEIRILGFLRTRIIPLRDVVAVSPVWQGFRLETEHGSSITVRRPGIDKTRALGLVDEVRRRIDDEAPLSIPAKLARGKTPIASWRATLAHQSQTYRTAGLDDERLVQCVMSRRLPQDVRVGAALALAAREERERLREAAGDLGHKGLRSLVERLAEGEAEDALVESALVRRRA